MSHSLTTLGALVLLSAAVPAQTYLHEMFNNNAAGWTLGPEWAIGPATASFGCSISVGLQQDPGHDADGKPGGGVAGAVLGGCASTSLHGFYYLTSPIVNTTGATNLRFEFDRWLNADYHPYMHSVVEVYDGASWVSIFTTGIAVTSAFAWTHFAYDVTAFSNAAFRIRFGYDVTQAGVYSVSGWNVDNVRLTNGEFFFDRFHNNAAGWTLDPEWAIGNAVASGPTACSGFGDPGYDADGTPAGGIAGVVLGGNNATVVHSFNYLTSPAIDTSSAAVLKLRFRRWLNADMSPYMNSNIEVWNGAFWGEIFATGFYCTTESAWSDQIFDVTPQKNAAFRVRFGFKTGSGAYAMSQWNIDNVSVYDPSSTCALSLAAYNGPGSIRLSAHCLPAAPGTTLFNCITLNGAGYPTGSFYGINPSFTTEVLVELAMGPPFLGVTDAQGRYTFDVPSGVPAGIVLYAVSIALSPAGYPITASAPTTFTTL